jgi:hypothetical protein
MSRSRITLCAVAFAIGCRRGPTLTAWTTGEPNAPPEVAAVYRAVLDAIFPNPSAPALIAMDRRAEPSWLEISAKHFRRIPPPLIAPFSYRIPIVFMDQPEEQELNKERMRADSIAGTVPISDIRYRQRSAAPFIEKFPGAWGLVRLSRVGFEHGFQSAVLDVWYRGIASEESGHEIFWLRRNDNEWKVVARDTREGSIQPKPLPARMLSGWVDSLNLPPPARRRVRIVVRDSVSGSRVPSVAILVQGVSADRQGRLVQAQGAQPLMTMFTDSTGQIDIRNPPRGYAYFDAVCPPQREVAGAPLAYAELNPDAGVDTVLTLRVRMASCRERAPFMAREAKRHVDDVARAKVDAAARAVRGEIQGTLRDARTGRPVPRALIRVDETGGIGGSDSTGRFWLGFAPGAHKIIVYCPVKRQMPSKKATIVRLNARPAMRDTMDVRVPLEGCEDVPVDTVHVRTKGVWSIGFEDGLFTPCERFSQIKLGGYVDWSHMADLEFADKTVQPPNGWPRIKPVDGHEKVFMDVDADLIGPGSYGHMGIATYLLRVTRIRAVSAATPSSCLN